MGTRALPDMYALSPRASGIHIRQSTRAHVITYTYKSRCTIIDHSCLVPTIHFHSYSGINFYFLRKSLLYN